MLASYHRRYLVLALLLAFVAVLSSRVFRTQPRYAPWIWSNPIGPGCGTPLSNPPSSEPGWGPPQGHLRLSPEFIRRPYGDSCFSAIAMDQADHRESCIGAACREVPNSNFFCAVFESHSDAAFFFEARTTHTGGSWTAWLVAHTHNPECDELYPIFIEQGFLTIQQSHKLHEELEKRGVRHLVFTEPDGELGPIYIVRFKSDSERLELIQTSDQERLAEFVQLIESCFVTQIERELRARFHEGEKSQGHWKLHNGTWPGERSSLFDEMDKSLRS